MTIIIAAAAENWYRDHPGSENQKPFVRRLRVLQTSKMIGMIIGFLSIVFLRYFFSTDLIFA